MNIVLLADKKHRKAFELAVKASPDINLLGTEPVIRPETIGRITELRNPHVLAVISGVPVKGGLSIPDLAALCRLKRPNMRIVFAANGMSTDELLRTAAVLRLSDVFDIIPEYSPQAMIAALRNPMTEAELDDMLAKLTAPAFPAYQQKIPENETSPEECAAETIPLKMSFPEIAAAKFDISKVIRVNEPEAETPQNGLLVGVAALQHHLGCTHTAFEIAAYLSEKEKSVCVVLADDEMLDNFSRFFGLDPEYIAGTGLNINGIEAFPLSKLGELRKEYGCVVCDFGFLRERTQKLFAEADARIMMCSGAEWDISLVSNYINYGSSAYTKDVSYCFSRIAKQKFLLYAKSFRLSGCTAYRLGHSQHWLKPCAENKAVYDEILGRYTLENRKKGMKRDTVRVK